MIRLTPELYLSHTSSEERDKREERHWTSLYLEELALGLTGRIGDRVEFSLIPSLQSKVFVAGLEVGYSFGGEEEPRRARRPSGKVKNLRSKIKQRLSEYESITYRQFVAQKTRFYSWVVQRSRRE